MSLQALKQGIETKFGIDFAAKQPGVPIAFPNDKFSQPNSAWIHFAMIPGDRFRTNIGSRRCTRQEGIFNIACMVPQDAGNKQLWEIVDSVHEILEDLQLNLSDGSTVTVYNADTRVRGVINGFETVNVQIEFRQDS